MWRLISGLLRTFIRSASFGLPRSFYSAVWMSCYLRELSEINSLNLLCKYVLDKWGLHQNMHWKTISRKRHTNFPLKSTISKGTIFFWWKGVIWKLACLHTIMLNSHDANALFANLGVKRNPKQLHFNIPNWYQPVTTKNSLFSTHTTWKNL